MMPEEHSEPYQRSKICQKAVNYFCKTLYLKCLSGFECASGCWNLFFNLFLIFPNCAFITQQAFSSLPSLWICDITTKQLSNHVAYFMQGLLETLPSYICHNSYFIQLLEFSYLLLIIPTHTFFGFLFDGLCTPNSTSVSYVLPFLNSILLHLK